MTTAESPAPDYRPWPFKVTPEFTPRPFQIAGVRAALDRAGDGHMFDIGLGGGKTTMSLAVAEVAQANRVLVLCPSKVIAVWPEEIRDNAIRRWEVWHGQVQGARGPLKNPSIARRAEALIQANTGALRVGRPFMAVVNYEAVIYRQMLALLLGTPWDLLICDESHKIAAPTGKTSKAIAKIGDRVRARGGRVILQTGTSLPHSDLSLFGQFRTLNPDVLGTGWTMFKQQWAAWKVIRERQVCDRCGRESRGEVGAVCLGCGGTVVKGEPIYMTTPRGDKIPDGVREDRRPELIRRVSPYITRVSQDELDAQTGLVDTPPSLRTIALDPVTRKVYDRLERDLIAEAAGATFTAANAMVNVLRLAQVTSGYGVDAVTGQVVPITEVPEKARLLADVLEDVDPREPVIVFGRFHYDLDQIRKVAEARGSRYGEISGRRSDGLEGHKMSPFVDVVGVQAKAGGAGINLTRSRLGIYYSTDFDLAAYLQSRRRYLRQGQTRLVSTVHLLCEDTIDLAVFYALKKRRNVNEAVLARLTNPNGDPS